MTDPDQPRVFERPHVVTRVVEVADIAPWGDAGAKSAVEKSIAALGGGLVDPVLQELPDGGEYRYRVLDGARRLTALVDAGATQVAAKVVPAELGDATAQAITLATNLNRASNPLKEALALKSLVEDHGYGEDEVAEMLGISINVVQKRLRLVRAPAELLAGVQSGAIAPGTAQRIANLNADEQAQLVQRYRETKRLTGADVAEVMRATRTSFLAGAAESGLFADLTEADAMLPQGGEWLARHLQLAREQGLSREDVLALVDAVYAEVTA